MKICAIVNAGKKESMVGFAQTHQGFALDPPPFEKSGPKLYLFNCHSYMQE